MGLCSLPGMGLLEKKTLEVYLTDIYYFFRPAEAG